MGGGGIVVEGAPQNNTAENCGKLRENLRKLRFFGKGSCGRDLKKFGFPDSGQAKGRQKNYKVQTESKPSRKKYFTYLG